MTCIVGVIDGDRIVMGGDSAGTEGMFQAPFATEKLFQNGEFLIGHTSDYRLGNLLRYRFTPPVPEEGSELHRYMATQFVDALRECLKAGGYAKREAEVESGGVFLVGYRGRLFIVEDNYQVMEFLDAFGACGSGSEVASGALYASKELPAEERIKLALEAAARYNTHVCAPFIIKHLEQK